VTFGEHIPTCSSSGKKQLLDVGGNDGKRGLEMYPDFQSHVLDLKNGWDVMRYGLPEGEWDVILANHFIEHVSDPDFFLDECRRVMASHTVLDIGTPNLTAWFNRIFFLGGYVPHSVELSKRYGLGKPFDWNKEELGGHIYIYTVGALKQLLTHHGFKIQSVVGEASSFPCPTAFLLLDKVLTHFSPTLASAFRIKCTL